MLQTYRSTLQSLTSTRGFIWIYYVYWAVEGVRYTYPTNVYVIVYNSAILQQCVAALAEPNHTFQHVQGFTFGWLSDPVDVFRLQVRNHISKSRQGIRFLQNFS